MTVSLISEKKLKIQKLCTLQENTIIIRLIDKLLAKFTSFFPGVKLARLHFRVLERDKILALKLSRGNFDKRITLSKYAKEDIKWWIKNIVDSYNTMVPSNYETIMKSDASKIEWGAVHNSTRTQEVFVPTLKKISILMYLN